MKKILPHIEIGQDENGIVALGMEDWELFDFIDDYVTETCGLVWDYFRSIKEKKKGVHTLYFSEKISMEEVEAFLFKLDAEEIEKIYSINNL